MIVRAFAGDSTMTRRLCFCCRPPAGHDSEAVKRLNTPRMRPSPLYNLIGVLSWPLCSTGSTGSARAGSENLPAEGGFVLACNHVSSFDPWPLGMPLWPKRLPALHGEVGALLVAADATSSNGAGAFPVRRGPARHRRRSRPRSRLAREGHAVAMFPEGTRRTKGLVKTLRGAPAHRRRADRARGRRPARARRPSKGTDRLLRLGEAPRRVRGAGRRSTTCAAGDLARPRTRRPSG